MDEGWLRLVPPIRAATVRYYSSAQIQDAGCVWNCINSIPGSAEDNTTRVSASIAQNGSERGVGHDTCSGGVVVTRGFWVKGLSLSLSLIEPDVLDTKGQPRGNRAE